MAKAANYDRVLTEQIDKLEEKKLNDIKVSSCNIENKIILRNHFRAI